MAKSRKRKRLVKKEGRMTVEQKCEKMSEIYL